MRKYNSENERMKRKYFNYLHEAKGRSERTVDSVVKALTRYEEFTGYENFKKFTSERAMEFKKRLMKETNRRGEPLSASTILHTLTPVKEFMQWICQERGYKKITHSSTQYFNMTDKDRRKTRPVRVKEYASFGQIRKALAFNPANDIEMRDRAMMAFFAATAIRDGALLGLKLKHFDVERKIVTQNPNEMETKFSKWITTRLFPVGDDIHQIVVDWVKYLREELLFGDNDPLFPKALLELDKNKSFKAQHLSKEHWKGAGAVREIVRRLFTNAGLRYYPPHRFRDSLSALGKELCKTPQEIIAWSMNYGHENWATTFITYGSGLNPDEQVNTLAGMEKKSIQQTSKQEILKKMGELLAEMS